jgi:hypothetical protein
LSVEFIKATLFTPLLPEYLTEDEYAQSQLYLANDPEARDVIQGTGRVPEGSVGDPRRGQGRRGDLRVIDDLLLQDSLIWLVTLHGKDEAADLTPSEKRLLKALRRRRGGSGPSSPLLRRKSLWRKRRRRRPSGAPSASSWRVSRKCANTAKVG